MTFSEDRDPYTQVESEMAALTAHIRKNTMKIYTQLWIEIGQSEKRKHKTGIADQSVPRA